MRWIDWLAVGPNLEVQVRPAGITRRTNCTNWLACVHDLPTRHIDPAEVAVQREQAAMRQHDAVAIAPIAPPGKNHRSIRRRESHGRIRLLVPAGLLRETSRSSPH